jgi:NAD(P)-dependent dehydrogenase (short-subunit alcohol dehydrogenase family)
MACRNLEKAETALAKILETNPHASVEIIGLDLADLSSVRNFAHEFKDRHQSLHILLNNAGIMFSPKLKTVDGFELQFGTNHLGHFALTGLLMERILDTDRSRVVTMSSFAHKTGRIDFDDLQEDQSYSRLGAYAQSKLANILFAYELHRRLRAAGSTVLSLCAHPGTARTNLGRKELGALSILYSLVRLFEQSAEDGALPMLYAATSPNVESGEYYGPSGWRELRGYPKRVESSEASHDEEVARRLWEISSELTGVRFNI